MNSIFNKIASITLACLVLFSTLSFSVEKHYCGQFLVDTALFSKAKDCGMEKMSLPDNMDTEVTTKSCCKDEIVVIEGQDELKKPFEKLNLSQQIFIITFTISYLERFITSDKESIGFKEYSPPKLVKNIHVLHETYLI